MGAMTQNIITQTLAKVTYYESQRKKKQHDTSLLSGVLEIRMKAPQGMAVLVSIALDLDEEPLEWMKGKFDEDEEVTFFIIFVSV